MTEPVVAAPVRWGVIGPGFVATRAMIPAIQRSTNGRVVAVASRDAARARAVAAEHAIPAAYADYAALLADPAVEAVYLALPNHLHAEWTLAAARARKQVLCEKPLARSAAEARTMADACAAAGVLLMEAVMYRFHPRMQHLHAMVRAGDLGAVRLLHAAFTFPLRTTENYRLVREYGGGALLDVGSYTVSAVRWLAGTEPSGVLAHATAWPGGGIDGQYTALLQFPSGAMASVACSFAAAEHQVVEVVGTQGVARAPRAFTAWLGEPAPLHVQREGRGEAALAFEADPYQHMVEHFADCLRAGRPTALPPAESIANLHVLDALAGQTPLATPPAP